MMKGINQVHTCKEEVTGANEIGKDGDALKASPDRKPAGIAYIALSLPCARHSKHTTS